MASTVKTARLPYLAPEMALAAFAEMPEIVFLDSAAPGDIRSQFSYLCLFPVARISLAQNPFDTLRRWLQDNRIDHMPEDWPFPFAGGAVGWIGYDLAREAAGVESRFMPMPDLPGGWFGLYTTVLGFDLARQELFYLGPEELLHGIKTRLEAISALPAIPRIVWSPEMSLATYSERHQELRKYIEAGDIYQANLTFRFTARKPDNWNVASLYTNLRHLSPAPFAACVQTPSFSLASASPERFLSLSVDGVIETRPIKGTAARHTDPDLDREAAVKLRSSQKERAENLMITDLLRNDLGKVCQTGSIRVPELWNVESFAQAHHLVSSVVGQLRPGLDAIDLLQATLPGGSITGAPKQRAMQIIDELEVGPRGAYCGALAWLSFNGAMDSAIIIRTITQAGGRLYAQAGGGITWDSLMQAEYDEAMLKMSPLLKVGL